MINIGEILISDDVIDEYFHCNLSACKGACCYEGDWGAPLEEDEINLIDDLLGKIKPILSDRSLALLEDEGFHTYYEEMEEEGTTLHEDGSCVFLTRDVKGVSKCGIEQAFEMGDIPFRKPISCHLYPVRRNRNPDLGFEALNYDQWDICNPACNLGAKMKIPLYKFAKSALIRAYGQAFYDQLEAVATHLEEQKDDS